MRLLITLLTVIIGLASAADERYYKTAICTFMGGQAEYSLPDKTRVDCLTSDYAIEFDFAPKWAISIGQTLYYGKMTGKHPAVILIIEKPSDWKYYHRLKRIADDYGITVWYMKSPEYDGKTPPKTDNDNFKVVCDYVRNLLKNLQ